MISFVKKIIGFAVFCLLFGLFLFYVLKFPKYYPKNMQEELPTNFFGVTYSKKYAEELGLDWKAVYLKMLDDLDIKYIRLPVYWDDIEKKEGVFDFSDYIFMIEEGEKRNVDFILSFGMRTPRWPECHVPEWINILDEEYLKEKTTTMLESVVNTFKKYESISYFQVENEPLLNTFGICPKSDYDFLKKEVDLVRKLDARPVIISATGELSLWSRETDIADVFGTTMYRVVHNPFLGYIKYPYNEGFYKTKAEILKLNADNVFIVELQAEPWLSMEKILDVNNREYLESFSLEQFRANARFAANTGFRRAYLWGVEWWYFRDIVADDSSYLDLAREIIK